MAYDFKLVLHGLVLLVFHGSDRQNLTEIDALVVDTQGMTGSHRHFPYLNFSLTDRDSSADAAYELVPGQDGKQFGRVSLEKAGTNPVVVTVQAAAGEGQSLAAVWSPSGIGSQTVPLWPHEEQWLDWVPSLKRANSSMEAPTSAVPFAGYKQDHVTARIKLLQGELSAADIVKNDAGHYMAWKFKPSGGGLVFSQALAKSIVLRLTGLTKPVSINVQRENKPDEICDLRSLVPGGEVTASVTNLPMTEPVADKRLTHFAMYYDLANWQGGGSPPPPNKLNLPEAPQDLDTSQGTVCTGGNGGGSGS